MAKKGTAVKKKPEVKPRIPIPVKTEAAKAEAYASKTVKLANDLLDILRERGADVPPIGEKNKVAALSPNSVGISSGGNAYVLRIEGATMSITVNKKRYVLG